MAETTGSQQTAKKSAATPTATKKKTVKKRKATSTATKGDKKGRKLVKKDFTFIHHVDPARSIAPHGVYLDDKERYDAETQRAVGENREPDYTNLPATQGTPLAQTEHAKAYYPGDYEVVPEVELTVAETTEDHESGTAAPEATPEPANPYTDEGKKKLGRNK